MPCAWGCRCREVQLEPGPRPPVRSRSQLQAAHEDAAAPPARAPSSRWAPAASAPPGPGTVLRVGAELDGGHGGAQGPPERVHRGALSPVPKRGKDRAATGLKAAPVPWMRGLGAALGAPRTGVRKRAVSGLLSLSRGTKLLALPFQCFPRALPSRKTAHIPMKKWCLHLLKWASNSLRLVPLHTVPANLQLIRRDRPRVLRL